MGKNGDMFLLKFVLTSANGSRDRKMRRKAPVAEASPRRRGQIEVRETERPIRMTNDKGPGYGNVTDAWTPPNAEIDSLPPSPHPDWAWTFLRRNIHYRAAALRNRQHWLATDTTAQGPSIYSSTARNLAAEEWGLCTFRRPGSSCIGFSAFLGSQ